MKQIFLLFTISVVFAAFGFKKTSSVDLTQLVVKAPEFSNDNLKSILEIEFENISGIKKCEINIKSKTLMLNYNSAKVGQDKIDRVLNKWDCNPEQYYYQKLY